MLLDAVPVRFLVLERGTVPPNFAYGYLEGVVKVYPNRWRLAYEAKQGDVRVYERIRHLGDISARVQTRHTPESIAVTTPNVY